MSAFGAPVTRFFGMSTNRPGGHRDTSPKFAPFIRRLTVKVS
jgi:hypothetical protein